MKAVRIAVTSGEPAGIGPELCLHLARPLHPDGRARPVVIGDRYLLADRARQMGLSVTLRDYLAADTGEAAMPGVLDVLHIPLACPAHPGRLDARNSPYVLGLLDRALAGCRSGEFAAMVTAPVHKGVINETGVAFTGHTEYLAEHTATPRVVMMLAGDTGEQASGRMPCAHGALRVALATTHLPLRAVPDALTPSLLTDVLRIVDRDLRLKYGLTAPRILVAGLNPHAGEGGHLGREEIEVIAPVIARLRDEGLQVSGPYPADTLFTPPMLAGGDVVLAMYHDQGLTALKYATFGRGINVTLGLPIIRTSVDHGTALDLAGQGRADPGSLFAAFAEATRMAAARKAS